MLYYEIARQETNRVGLARKAKIAIRHFILVPFVVSQSRETSDG